MYFNYGSEEIAYLKQKDKRLADVIDKVGKIERPVDTDLFSSVIHHIIGQQISTKAQTTIWQRMNDNLGVVNSDTILAAGTEHLQSFGITFRKAEYITDFARKIKDGSFDLEGILEKSDEEAIKELSGLQGIGVWTAEMILLFCMQRPNIFSFGDLAILRGIRMVYHHRKIDCKLFEKYRRRFSPYCSVASLYFWAVAGGAIPEMKDCAPKGKMTYIYHYDSPLGGITVSSNGREITGLWFDGQKYFGDTLPEDYKEKDLPVFKQTKKWLDIYFSGKAPDFTPPIKMETTSFRKAVWEIMLTIPFGQTMTYGEIADSIAKQKGVAKMSAQAVGGAVGHNSISLIIPCHRVVGTNGNLTGYAGGIEKKVRLLTMEQKTTC